MDYSSVIFLFYFLPILLAVYYMLPGIRLKNIFLFIASLLFYMWGAGELLFLLVVIGFCAWGFAYLIANSRQKKLFLLLAIIVYLLVLIYYKYTSFIIVKPIATDIGGLPTIKFMMPIGVSFFIFQAISYNIDVYRDNSIMQKNPATIVLYITMFPQLLSGPLVRFGQMESQLKRRTFDFDRFAEGIRRFIIGLGKKALIANPLGLLVSQIMAKDTGPIDASAAWIGIIAYTLQIFFDFAGYTDMAIGAGKMLGFDLPENFNFPYISRSITEFWRRWHMTLSAWLRDYLYTPLSIKMRNWHHAGIFISLMITFTLCGLWHGSTWNFIVWGAYQGLFLGIETLFLAKFLKKLKAGAIVYSLLVIMIGWVFFRLPDMNSALDYLKAMFSSGSTCSLTADAFLTNEHKAILIAGILFCIPFPYPKRIKNEIMTSLITWITAVLLITVFILSVMSIVTETYSPFLYFQF